MADDSKRDAGTDGDRPKASRVPGREARPALKRFYKAVTVAADDGGFAVHLDNRPVRTPAKAVLRVGSEPLARAIAEEWEEQKVEILPATMPLTTLVCTALDAVAAMRSDVAEEIARYAQSDLLCYRAEAPRELVERQEAGWDPELAWAAREFGVPFRCATGIVAVEQSPKLRGAVLEALQPLGPLRLAAMHVLTTLVGSAVLAFGVLHKRLSVDALWRLGHIDENWQIEKWGGDREAEARAAARLRDARAAARLLDLTRPSD